MVSQLLPVLNYDSFPKEKHELLFGGCDIGEIKDLQVLQNKAGQIVTKSPPRSPRHSMFDKLGCFSLNQLVVYHTVISIFKIRTYGKPELLASSLKNDNVVNGHIFLPKPTRQGLARLSKKSRYRQLFLSLGRS